MRRSRGSKGRSNAPRECSQPSRSPPGGPRTSSRRSARSSSATGVSSTQSATSWVGALSPWPKEGFGLDRIHALLGRLGNPETRYLAIHVVGTNGKSTTTRMIEALLLDAGLRVGTYLSPHVRTWSERIRVNGEDADFERAVARIRPLAGDAAQFEILTAAALTEFAHAEVDVAVVEAGLGGRHDATNVPRTRVVRATKPRLA